MCAARAALTIGLGGAEARGPSKEGGPWLAVEYTDWSADRQSHHAPHLLALLFSWALP